MGIPSRGKMDLGPLGFRAREVEVGEDKRIREGIGLNRGDGARKRESR